MHRPPLSFLLLPMAFLLAACQAPQRPPSSTPASDATGAAPATPSTPASLIAPDDLVYRGAFLLPEGGERPRTFAYGAGAMTFNPAGDPGGPQDGFPGSLFITGHDRMPYGELPDGGQVAEISIPIPVTQRDLTQLNRAGFMQDLHDIARGLFPGLDEIPRLGMLYLDTPLTGARVHLTWGQHLDPDPPQPTHILFDPDLARPDVRGPWFLGDAHPASLTGYLLEIPAAWAQAYTQGRPVGTGRFRDGGWSGMGPALFAYRPWDEASGAAAAAGERLPLTTLLHYATSYDTESIERALDGYQHPDEWEGAAWLTTPDGRSAVLFAGTKATGRAYWYGYPHPFNPEQPCVEVELIGEFPVCRMADGSPCPAQDLAGCRDHSEFRGWWSTRFDAQFLLYDPDDLARVAAGELAPWEPQPYAVVDIDEHLYLNPAGVELQMLGAGDQRRFRIGEAAYDRANGLLYVLELFADGEQPVVHVWELR